MKEKPVIEFRDIFILIHFVILIYATVVQNAYGMGYSMFIMWVGITGDRSY